MGHSAFFLVAPPIALKILPLCKDRMLLLSLAGVIACACKIIKSYLASKVLGSEDKKRRKLQESRRAFLLKLSVEFQLLYRAKFHYEAAVICDGEGDCVAAGYFDYFVLKVHSDFVRIFCVAENFRLVAQLRI